MEKTSRGGRAPPRYLDFREPPPHVLNKEKHFTSSKPGPVINTPLLLFMGLFGLGGAFFPLNGVSAACFFKEVENGNYNHYM